MRLRVLLYNGVAQAIPCRGFGACGTCAVKIEGDVTPPMSIEKWRMGFPSHRPESDLRLACQCDDLQVTKGNGMWGHK